MNDTSTVTRAGALPVFICMLSLTALLCLGTAFCRAETLVLPKQIVSIENEAFMGDASITELVVQEGATDIGARAFADTGLNTITLPSTLTYIADDAFDGCDIVAARAPYGSVAFEYCFAKGWPLTGPWTSAMSVTTYNGVAFKVVNTAVDPVAFSGLTYQKCCQAPNTEGINRYGGRCLHFSYYYVHCMVDGVTALSLSDGNRGVNGTPHYSTEKYSDPQKMMARLYDLLNTGVPQILMVEAITHAGSRHFLAVVGYRADVESREDLRPEDLLVIDTFDGKLESMDPAIEPVDTRHLFKQDGRYRIEAASVKR
ncbi:MAG: leucine-rich repeat domain-containing protein [Clostridiales bacterium]|nr:leucine-rich repeat domain-containing protein [Clostridiales bacterium]